MIYTISKVLKTKEKELFKTEDIKEFEKYVREILLISRFEKPYFFGHIKGIYAETIYALRQFIRLPDNQEIIISPEELEKLFIKEVNNGTD